jgi:hypothetical protein
VGLEVAELVGAVVVPVSAWAIATLPATDPAVRIPARPNPMTGLR